MKLKANWDGLGIATSLACAIHCAVLPIFLTSLPLFGINIIHHPAFEWSMIALAILIGTYSLCHGYIKHHRNRTPVILFSIGATFLILKQFFHEYQVPLLVLAVAFIVYAHYSNYRYCHRSRCSSSHHSH
ncbi:MAG: MerC domain-containing protein [Chitinophagaceae bacterium]|nr:MAG: MerC domain-containing protein [Chitinophagaceae bacterium]